MISGDLPEDGVGVSGPGEGGGILIAGVDVGGRGFLERGDAGEDAAAELLLRQVGEDAFDLIEPAKALSKRQSHFPMPPEGLEPSTR